MNPVEDLLTQKNITYRIQGKDFIVKCFNPEHDDSNPSMRIDMEIGIFNCLSCGYRGNVFKHFGILGTNINIRIAKLKKKIRDLVQSIQGLSLPDNSVPFKESFRGISAKTLKRFGAFTTDTITELEDRIIFPIKDATDKTVVFLGRHVLSNANPKYVIYPRGVTVPTYPIKMRKGTNSIVLVEGIFDMLNCVDKGLENVVCVFGTQTLKASADKKLLFYKAQGITKVFIMFDGDNPGREAAAELEPIIKELGFQVEIINLEEGTDPGELSQDYINSIIEYTK